MEEKPIITKGGTFGRVQITLPMAVKESMLSWQKLSGMCKAEFLSAALMVGLPYHSSHKFRHGHAVYAIKNAKDIQALKAGIQNLVHANLSITDGVYGVLSEKDVKTQIANLGKKIANDDNQDLAAQVRALEISINNLKNIMGV